MGCIGLVFVVAVVGNKSSVWIRFLWGDSSVAELACIPGEEEEEMVGRVGCGNPK